MLSTLVLLPFLSGLVALFVRSDFPRRLILVSVALAHFVLTCLTWVGPDSAQPGDWLRLDMLARVFLSILSLLFLGAAVYSLDYLEVERHGADHEDFEEGFIFRNGPEAIFTGCLLLFLAAMTLSLVSQHFLLIWAAVEASTLFSAPCIYFHRHHRSLEATWKYLMICSVGVSMALLGNFFLAVACRDLDVPLLLGPLLESARRLDGTWLRAAFWLLLIGYGTKVGWAPMHNWLPDAHGEGPSVVSALLSGALLNCALLSVLRMVQVMEAAGQGEVARTLLLAIGIFSMFVSAVFILGQPDYKRMLAYSSVEHMGILAVGFGLGGVGAFGALLHAVGHSLAKALMFLTSGMILQRYRTREIARVHGLAREMPITGLLWVTGFLAITGAPPFSLFISELTILKAALDQGRPLVAALFLTLLAVVFMGMVRLLEMDLGVPEARLPHRGTWEKPLMWLPCLTFAVLLVIWGVCPPASWRNVLQVAASLLAGGPP